MICLTPFACRSGQTSSMLGGAQFKATLLDQKALFSYIQCKMTDSNSWQTRVDGKQLLTLTGVCPYLLTILHRGHSGQKMQCYRKWIDSTKLQNCQFMHENWFFMVSQTQIHTLYIYCSATPTGFPSHHGGTQVMDAFRACQVPEVSKGKIKEHLPKGWAMDLEALEPHKWSLPYEQYRTIASTRANPPWQVTLVVACSSQRSEHFSLFSVAENWAPLIFSCSHNQSNPFNLSNLHHKRKSHIWTQNGKKKIIFTKFVQYTHLIFYGTRCTRRKRAMALKQVYLSSAVTTNEDSWKPVFSVLLEHRAFLMAPAKDHRLLFPSGAMMLHLISPDFMLVSF